MKQKGSVLNKVDYDIIHDMIRSEVKELTAGLPTRDEFYGKMDEMIGEVKGMRAEFAAHKSSHERVDDDIRNLKKNVTHLYKTFEIDAPADPATL
jgi:uncharacterized protein YdcH (DUF465 family)